MALIDNRLSFRLPRPFALELHERAAKRGVSPSILARQILVASLVEETRSSMAAAIEDLTEEVSELRDALPRGLALLLWNLREDLDRNEVLELFEASLEAGSKDA